MDIRNNKKMRLGAKIAIHIFCMCCVGVLLLWLGTVWLDFWTDHGHYEVVPEVKGLQYEQAVERLTGNGFQVELSDSVYDLNEKPGTVVDQSPKVNTKVKSKRMIYLTVNAFSPKTVTLPNLSDVSLRQARSILEGLGIKNIIVREVPSEFKDLVLAVKRSGQRLAVGVRIPITATIEIEVGAGLSEENADSIYAKDTIPVSADYLDLL